MLSGGVGNTAEEKDKLVSSTGANGLTGGCGADRFVVKRQIHRTETGTTDCSISIICLILLQVRR